MSSIMKFIVMAVAWLLFTLLTFYTCVKPECCGADGDLGAVAPTEQPVAPAVTDDYAIVSSYGSNEVLTGAQWSPMLQGLLDRYKSDSTQALEVTGYYYDGETTPAGFDNMGFFRADEIKQLLVARGVPADNIRMLSEKLTGARPADDKLFPAGDFAWGKMVDAANPNAPELVTRDDDKDFEKPIKIRFPFDKSTRNLGNEIETYLKTLAERVSETKETVTIVGHTDNVDTEAYNMKLGQERADFVKRRLVQYGAPANLISTSSQGENSPESSNATSEGRRINRRAVVTLNKKAQ